MESRFISHNGKLIEEKDAVVSISSVEFSYGFGVYETIRVSHGVSQFLSEHLERLMHSAKVIGLEYPFTPESIEKSITELVKVNSADTCNLKILLIGAPKKEDADIYIMCLNPLFPDKKLYRDGARTTLYKYERALPQAKTLNMLMSYLAYREAKKTGAYDALLIANDGSVLEGTRTNFFCIQNKTIISPPEKRILSGVMRMAVKKCAKKEGYDFVERDIPVTSVGHFDGAFITSTSTKIMPLCSIGEQEIKIPDSLRELMQKFEVFLEDSRGKL